MIIEFANRVKKNEKKSRQAVPKILLKKKTQQANQQTKTFQVLFLSRAEIIFNNYPKKKRKKKQNHLSRSWTGGWDR